VLAAVAETVLGESSASVTLTALVPAAAYACEPLTANVEPERVTCPPSCHRRPLNRGVEVAGREGGIGVGKGGHGAAERLARRGRNRASGSSQHVEIGDVAEALALAVNAGTDFVSTTWTLIGKLPSSA